MFRRICEICLINLSCQFQLNRTCNHTCLCLYGICIFIRSIFPPITNKTDLLWIPWCSFVFRVSLLDMSNIICLCRSIKISKLTSLNQTRAKNIIYLTSRNRSIATILQLGDNRGEIGLYNKSFSWMFEKGFFKRKHQVIQTYTSTGSLLLVSHVMSQRNHWSKNRPTVQKKRALSHSLFHFVSPLYMVFWATIYLSFT